MAIVINPNAIQKGSITKEMLTQGARKPIILTPETTEVDEETYQKLFPDGITTNDVDVMFRIGEYDYGLFLSLESTSIQDAEGYNELIFTGLGGGRNLQSIYIWGYSAKINTGTPHQCSVTELQGKALNDILSEAGYLNKSILNPVLKEIDLTGTDTERKVKLDQFERDWKALTGVDDLTGARFVGNYEGELLIMAYSFANGEYEGINVGSTDQMIYRYVLELGGTLHITPLFSHLEPVEIFTDNSVASKQKNIDNLNAYKSNLTELGVDTNKSFQVPFREGDEATFIGTLQYSVDTNTYIGVGCASDEDTARIIRISSTGESTITTLALADNLSRILRDFGMYPELEPVPLNSEVTGKYINSEGKYVDASDWNIASIGAVSLGNTYLLNMVSSANMVLGVALFVSRVYKRDKEGKIIGTTLTPLFSAKNTSIPASGYVLFEAMDDYDEVLVCYKPALTTQMLVARWGFKASIATQLRNLRLIVDNKTDFEGIYELLTAGYALNLVGKGNGEPQAFMSRKTGGGNITDGSAVIKEVDGVQPIVWNQKNDMLSLNWHSINNLIRKEDGGIYVGVTIDNSYAKLNANFPNHKYLIVEMVKGNVNPTSYIGNSPFVLTETINTRYRFYEGEIPAVGFYAGYESQGGYGDDKWFWFKQCVYDLTQMFGAGNEPSTYEEYLDRISHYHIADEYAYNAGEVVNYKGTGIKTTGRNLWDEEYVADGYYNGAGVWVSALILSSKNHIAVSPNASYFVGYFGGNSDVSIGVTYWDANKVFIRRDSGTQNSIITTPTNCAYILFNCNTNYGTTYKGDICINLSDTAFNGQYEPYKSYVRDWRDVMKKYFPDGMTSLNGVKDFFNDKKAVRKWGCKVFDGTEEWIYTGGGTPYFACEGISAAGGNISELRPVACNYYPFGKGNWYNNKLNTVCISNGKTIIITDTKYTTASDWKRYLADLYAQGNPLVVYYELAEPVEDIFEKPLNLTYTVINGGTETSLATENSTQFEGSIAYNKDYVAVVDELQMQNRVTQIEFENWEN